MHLILNLKEKMEEKEDAFAKRQDAWKNIVNVMLLEKGVVLNVNV